MNDEIMMEKIKKAGELFNEISDYFKSDLISARMLRADITVLMKKREELSKQNQAIIEENENLKRQAETYYLTKKSEADEIESKAKKVYADSLVARETKKAEKEKEKETSYIKSKLKDTL